jgi:hypothetical protein
LAPIKATQPPSSLPSVTSFNARIALRDGGDQHFLERTIVATVDREFNRQIAQAEKCHA